MGVDDIPAVFAGEIVDRVDLTESNVTNCRRACWCRRSCRSTTPTGCSPNCTPPQKTFKSAGVRKVWVFQAFDDAREVLILQDIDTEDNARRWIHQHDAAADWMEHAGVGVYPPLFVGEFLKMVRVDDPDADEGR